ncbi:hypothetical protein FVE85_0770 [Porphyridium purpureum]|uniref:Uncharacterized protein n=1 Tax=Porphyridium purpureum TaxID=35688 RepID=A0A5J4YZG2_PORPP|nr:hypothetical protein FVE85_0770 [Porphyridium purpureum]|eukprot:POR1999..scf208_2
MPALALFAAAPSHVLSLKASLCACPTKWGYGTFATTSAPLAGTARRVKRTRLHVHGVSRVVVTCQSGSAAGGEDREKDQEKAQGRDIFADRSDSGTRDIEFDVASSYSSSAEDGREGQKGDVGSDDSDDERESSSPLFALIRDVPPPELVARFAKTAPPQVQDAFKATLRGMLGTLSPALYTISLRTVTANLVQLMQSCILNGYLLRNVAYRVSLAKSLENTDSSSQNYKSLPQSNGSESEDDDGGKSSETLARFPSLPNVEPQIQDGVARFDAGNGNTVEIPVEQYISEMRTEVESLKKEIKRLREEDGTDLVKYIQKMEPDNLQELTQSAGAEVVDAMNKVVSAVLQSQRLPPNPLAAVETNASELGQLLFWLMVVGFYLREAEVKLGLTQNFKMFTAFSEDGSDPGASPKKAN